MKTLTAFKAIFALTIFTLSSNGSFAHCSAAPDPNFVLPVTYTSFTGVATNNKVLLSWLTEQELNTNHFEVEQSFDNSSFKTSGLVLDGFEQGANAKSYQFKDNSAQLLSHDIVYYRLKLIDNDGIATYSKTIAIKLNTVGSTIMKVSPNPFAEKLYVKYNSNETGNAEVRINNVTGQTVIFKQAIINKGYNNVQVSGLGGLTNGIYVAQLVMNGTVIDKQKVVKN
jgi:hypothetical protein